MEGSDQRAADAAEVSKRTGVPENLLMHVSNRENMEALATAIKEDWRKQKPSRPLTNREKFAELAAKELDESNTITGEFWRALC